MGCVALVLNFEKGYMLTCTLGCLALVLNFEKVHICLLVHWDVKQGADDVNVRLKAMMRSISITPN